MNLCISDSLRAAYIKSFFYINDQPIGKLTLQNENSKIIIDLLNGAMRRRGIILHPGTNNSLYLSVVLAAYGVFLSDESNNNAFLQEIKEGDLVLYGDKRGKYRGIDKDGKIIIEGAGKLITYVPTALTYKLKPYYGTATALDGRGIRRNSTARFKFLANLFSLELNQMRNTFKKSVVVVCEKSDADEFINTFRIGLDMRKSFSFGELFPSSYYTISGEEINYPGNPSKQEPMVKFVGKLSVARQLILEDRNISALLISGPHLFNDSTELVSLFRRNSLKSIIMMGEMSKNIHSLNLENLEEVEIYAWTKNTLNDKIDDLAQSLNDYAPLSKWSYEMANNYINKEIHTTFLGDFLDKESVNRCRKMLYQISKNNINEDIEQFVIKGFTLFNHFQRSIFPLAEMERQGADKKSRFVAPSNIIANMKGILNRNTISNVADNMLNVISLLSEFMATVSGDNPKYDCLKEIISANRFEKRRIAIIVSKNYYIDIFKASLPAYLATIAEKIDFFTPSNFNTKNKYDEIIFSGVFSWIHLDPFSIGNSKKVTVMLYENEQSLYKQARALSDTRTHEIEKISKLVLKNESKESLASEYTSLYEDTEMAIEDELEDIIRKSYKKTINIHSIESGGKVEAEIVKVAVLETGEYVYFTPHYNAYVFSTEKQVVVETYATELNSGDLIIFPNNDSGTKDIVEKIMQRMISENKFDDRFKECHRKSKHWKMALKEYMTHRRLTYKELSVRLHEIGKGKHEATLRSWLDEDSHIVGPRDSESYYAIAMLTNDPEMLKDPDLYQEASNEIRSMRIRILRFIASQIIKAYGRSEISSDALFADLSEDIERMSVLVEIESIVSVDNISVPAHMANRPVHIN